MINEKEILRKELVDKIDRLIHKKTGIPQEFLDYLDRFSALDNDTLVFMLSAIGENDYAIRAINIVLKARGGSHNVNLVTMEQGSPN
jgi:hypothetical protein